MIDERTEELASLYVLGALSPEELKVFEAQVRVDAELQTLVAELRHSVVALAGTVPAVEPPAAIKAQLMLAIADQRQSRSPRFADRVSIKQWIPWAVAASLALVCVLFIQQEHALQEQNVAQQQRINELNMMADALRAEGADLRQTVATLRENTRLADVRIAVLGSLLKSAPKAVAVSLWDNQRQSGVFVVHNLKPPAPGKDYQLWVIDPSRPAPVSAGVFQVDADGNVRVQFRATAPIRTAGQFAVTQEMKGGVATPTLNAMVLMGS